MIYSPWQDAINPLFLQRLLRPLLRPGVIPDTLAVRIFERSRRFTQRLSLLHQFQQRWGKQSTLQLANVPIVYPQWVGFMQPATTHGIPTYLDSKNINLNVNLSVQQIEPIVNQIMDQIVSQQFINESQNSDNNLLIVQETNENPSISTFTSQVGIVNLPIVQGLMAPESLDNKPKNIAQKEILPSEKENQSLGSNPLVVQTKNENPANKTDFTIVSSLPLAENPSFVPEIIIRANPQPLVSGIQQDGLGQSLPPSLISSKLRSPKTSEEQLLEPTFSDTTPLPLLPLVQAEKVSGFPLSSSMSGQTHPLVLARMASVPISSANEYQESSSIPTTSAQKSAERSPIVTAQLTVHKLSKSSQPISQTSPINVNRLTQAVERKLMRKITVERERRGQQVWH